MMHTTWIFTTLLALMLSLSACTSSPSSSSLDEEMAADTPTEESVGDASLDGSEQAATPDENDVEMAVEDFDKAESDKVEAQNESLDEQELEQELDLDDLQAEDVVQTPEPPALEEEAPVESAPLADAPAASDPFATAPAPDVGAPAANVTINNIRFVANSAGGTVVVDASGPIQQESRFNPQNGQYVVEMENATLPERLKRSISTVGASTIESINAYQVPGSTSVRLVVQLKPGYNVEPTLQEEGNSLVLVPPSTPSVAQQPTTYSGDVAVESAPNTPLGAQSMELFLMNNQKFYGKPISLQVRDADIRDVISFVAEESGANIVISDTVGGQISLKLRQIPWDQALFSIMRTKDLGYVRQGNVIRVATMAELRAETETARLMITAQKEMSPVRVKVIPINYANVDDLVGRVTTFLSKEGRAIADPRSNSLVITDREDILDKVTRLVSALDIQPNQVLIEGKVVEAVENFVSQIGVNWNATGASRTLSQTGGVQGTPLQITPNLALNSSTTSAVNVLGFRIGRLDLLGDLTASLRLAESENAAKVISSPRIVAMNRETAEISQVGEQVSIVVTNDTLTNDKTKSEKRTKVNLRLAVTPQITSDGSVIMDMDVVREFAGAEVDTDTKARPINTRRAKTKVLVRNGQTAVIGGIYQVDDVQTEEGVPFLKDVPVLGWLFKTKSKQRDKNELLIFLTPRILLDQNEQTAASL